MDEAKLLALCGEALVLFSQATGQQRLGGIAHELWCERVQEWRDRFATLTGE